MTVPDPYHIVYAELCNLRLSLLSSVALFMLLAVQYPRYLAINA